MPVPVGGNGQVVAGSSGLEVEVGDLNTGSGLDLGSWVGEGEAEEGREEEDGLHF